MNKMIRLATAFIFFLSTSAQAQLFNPTGQGATQANEFFVGRDYGKPLIKVNLMSGVNRPGVYHLPMGSDLAELISYAGGAVERADLANIQIRREEKSTKSVLDIDLKDRFGETEALPMLSDQDIVHIPVNTAMEKSMTWISLFSGLASIALSIAIIRDTQED